MCSQARLCSYHSASGFVRSVWYGNGMADQRSGVGAVGELIASAFLERQGVGIERRNVRVGRGEIDLVGRLNGNQLLVEVRTRRSEVPPIEAFDHAKRERLRRLSREFGVGRVDLVAVAIGDRFVTVHWIPYAL